MFELHDIDRPYPGLRQFEAWETEIFFGRQAHIERLLEILGRERFLAVIGPSGSGKSSLVRAGLLPALPQGRLHTGTRWRVAILRPGNEPIGRLARALLQPEALGESLLSPERIPPTPDTQTLDTALLEAQLRRGPFSLVEVAALATRRQAEADAALGVERPPLNLLVLVDQFEEVFTHLDAAAGGAEGRRALAEDNDAFVNLLLAPRTVPQARVFVVLTMRTDFLGACMRFSDLPDAINRAQYLTPRLQSDEIALAITGPAHHFGGDIDPLLVQELINAVGTDADQLPLLQHALSRMWTFAAERAAPGEAPRIEERDFQRAGGVREALSSHADSVLAALADQAAVGEKLSPAQVLARELFCAITEQRGADSGGQTVRRPQSLAAIAERAGRSPEDYVPVVRAFAEESANFLTYQGALGPATVVDISHEALIRQWGRLRQWVADEARRAGEYRRLRRQAREFVAGEVGAALLGGAALARALEWMNGGGAATDDWRPSATWAARYARDPAPEGARAEYQQVEFFVGESADHAASAERRAAREEAQRRQAEKAEIEREAAVALLAEKDLRMHAEQRRTEEARRAAARQRRMSVLLFIAAVVALALAAYSAILTGEANERRELVEAQAHVLKGQALWLPLAIESGRLSAKDADALLRVLRADGENLSAFASQLRDEEFLAERFVRAPAPLLAAMAGPSPAAREALLQRFDPKPVAMAGASARTLARALLRLALVEEPAADHALAQEVAAAAIGYSDDDREGWRVFGRALQSLAPDLPAARARELFAAMKTAAGDPAATSAQSLTLSVGMGVLRAHAPDKEMAPLFDRLLRASLEGGASEARRGMALERIEGEGEAGADELPVSGLRRDALRLLLARVADRLPPEDAKERWRIVRHEIRLKRGGRGGALAVPAGPGLSALAGMREAGRRGLDRRDLAQLLPSLADRLPPAADAAAYDELMAALLEEFWADRGTHRDPDLAESEAAVHAYGKALERLALALSPARVPAEAVRLMALAGERGKPVATRGVFLDILAQLLRRMTEADAGDFARRLAAMRWDPEDAFHDEPSRADARWLWSVLAERLPVSALDLVPDWAREDVPSNAAQAREREARRVPQGAETSIDALMGRITATEDADALQSLGRMLAAAVQAAPAAQLAATADGLRDALVASGDEDQRAALGLGLQAAAARLPHEAADALRHRIIPEMNADGADDLRAELWSAYAALVTTSSAGERQAIVHELLVLIETAHAPVPRAGATLMHLAMQLDAAQGAALLRDVLAAMAGVPESPVISSDISLNVVRSAGLWRQDAVPAERMQALEPIAVALAKGVEPGARDNVREGVIGAILASHSMAGTDALGRVLRALGGDTQSERRRAAAQAMAALPRAVRAQEVAAFAAAAQAQLDKLPPSYEVARDMFELMKYPDAARRAAAGLREKFDHAPDADAGLLALVAWARRTWPQLPLDRRPAGL